MGQEKLDEVVIDSQFKLEEALSSVRFYWNLARQRNQKVVVQIWSLPKVYHETQAVQTKELGSNA